MLFLLLFFTSTSNAQVVYDWNIADPPVVTSNIDALYNQHAVNFTFVVDVSESEQNISCIPRQETGSAHHPSCNITSVLTGPAQLIQLLSTATIEDSGVVEPVCVANGGYACAAAYVDTEPKGLLEGDVVTASWVATASSNYYELLVVLIDTTTGEPAWGYGRRGVSSVSNHSFVIHTSGNYVLRFYAGGYLYESNSRPELQSDITLTSISITTNTSVSPTISPTISPSTTPSTTPSTSPTSTPSRTPSTTPSTSPSSTPTTSPTATLSASPSVTPCSAGRYRDSQASSCRPCPVNTFTNETDVTACEPCSTGFFTNQTESTACQELPYSETSHLPAENEIPTSCNATRSAVIAGDDSAYLQGLNSTEAAVCIQALFASFIKRSSEEESPALWGASAIRLYPSETIRAEGGVNTLAIGVRARIVQLEKPAAGVNTTIAPCLCDSPSTNVCLKRLYFTADDLFSASSPPEWEVYRGGELVTCNGSSVEVQGADLPFAVQGRRMLQEGSDSDPVFASNSPDQTSTTPTVTPSSAPSSSPTVKVVAEPPFATSTTAIIIYAVSGILGISINGCIIYTLARIQRGGQVKQPEDISSVVTDFVDKMRV